MMAIDSFISFVCALQPERIGGQPYSYTCDIWSMALSLLTCRIGEFAIPHNSHWELVNAIQAGPAILNCTIHTAANLLPSALCCSDSHFSRCHCSVTVSAYSSDQVSDTLRDLLSHWSACNDSSGGRMACSR
jgi:serine/threonine protein kinase